MDSAVPDAASAQADLVVDLGARFDHFAVATRRIRDALPLWRDAMGGRFTVGADNAEIGWRTVRLEFAGAPCVDTFYTDDVEAAFTHLAARGYEPFGADDRWFQLFVHPRLAGGVLLQLMNPSVLSPSPLEMTLDDVLAGGGFQGTGIPSP
jgi:methylmalonyl-CoA/ethylmalonyl-CoA epimerase